MRLTFSNMDYLGCQDCDRLAKALIPGCDNAECNNLKEGCTILMAMLETNELIEYHEKEIHDHFYSLDLLKTRKKRLINLGGLNHV
jgi:hypothetical protein